MPSDAPELPQDPRQREIFLRTLREHSDNCEPPARRPSTQGRPRSTIRPICATIRSTISSSSASLGTTPLGSPAFKAGEMGDPRPAGSIGRFSRTRSPSSYAMQLQEG